MRAFATAGLFGLVIAPAIAIAAPDCRGPLVQGPLALPATVTVPVAAELGSRTSQLGMPSGVLAQPVDPAQSLDRVLLRLRIVNCRDIAKALPAERAVANPGDPAAYKPKTQYDNTPYRFNMTQNGKRMTADDFDAWLKANGYSAGRRADSATPAAAAPAAAPAATPSKD